MNARAADEPHAPAPRLDARPFERTLTGDDPRAYRRGGLPADDAPRVVVLDNAGIHTRRAVKGARPGLAKAGIYLYDLPPYSPERDRSEPVFKQIKHRDILARSYASRSELRRAVESGFDT